VRIAQATKQGSWGKVRALQRLLTHSNSGKVLAVRRVKENTGKKTPGVDQEIWNTPEKKIQAVHALKRRGYQPQPLRRVYIPKSDGKTMRPLGIPTMKDRAQQAMYCLALDPVVETVPLWVPSATVLRRCARTVPCTEERKNGVDSGRRYQELP
jgi:RNA-directed DNA polymerase